MYHGPSVCVCLCVSMSVYLLLITVNCAKTTELIKMSFEVIFHVDKRKKPCIRRCTDGRHLANTVECSMLCSNVGCH